MSGLSNHQPMLIRYLHCPELMGRMMERTGVSPTEAARVDGGLAWLEARTKCITVAMSGNAAIGLRALIRAAPPT